MKIYQRKLLELIINYKSLKFGKFKLNSGRISPYFFNMETLHTADNLIKLGEIYSNCIIDNKFNFDQLFGLSYKGIPLVLSTAIAFKKIYNKNLSWAFDRKEIIEHEKHKQIVGAELKGDVLILDDVITSGMAIKYAINLIKNVGANPCGVVVAIDRQEKGNSNLSAVQAIASEYHIPVISILSLKNIMDFCQDEVLWKDVYNEIAEYHNTYSVLES